MKQPAQEDVFRAGCLFVDSREPAKYTCAFVVVSGFVCHQVKHAVQAVEFLSFRPGDGQNILTNLAQGSDFTDDIPGIINALSGERRQSLSIQAQFRLSGKTIIFRKQHESGRDFFQME